MIEVVQEIFDPVARQRYNPASIQAARFIGTLENETITCMACLLQDGSILTTLHSIFDFETDKYIDLDDTTVTFVYQNKLYIYILGEKIHDGMQAILNNAYPFDYARFKLIGNPVTDLGGGLKLDRTQHYGRAYNSDPHITQAISGPILSHDDDGNLTAKQIISTSQNTAASSTYYFFNQEGDHIGGEGFTSQAILYPNSSTLYAIHIGLDGMQKKRFGMKISEYLLAYQRSNTNPSAMQLSPRIQTHKTDLILHIKREKLRHKGADRKDIARFLAQLKYASKHDGNWQGAIPDSLKRQVLDSHQPQHQFNSRRKKKGYFYKHFGSEQSPVMHALANCLIKLASEYYYCYLKTTNPIQNYNIRHNTRFVIDLDIEVGIDIDAGNFATSQVYVHGFDGELCHIYPVVAKCLVGVLPTCINAQAILDESNERELIDEQRRKEALNCRYAHK